MAAPDDQWRRWEPTMETVGWPLALRMAQVAEVGAGQRVLDVGCGIGDPTLQVAVLVGPHGRVVGIDLSRDALRTADERARALGLSNVEFIAADVRDMALGDGSFDVVLGRWSLTHIEDVGPVLARLRGALVPGGRIAVAGWAPLDANPWITLPRDVLARVAGRAPVAMPTAAGFDLAADGELARRLVVAGFQMVGQERVALSYFARDADEFWRMLTAVGPLGQEAADVDAATEAAIVAALGEALAVYRSGDVLRIPAQAQLAWGRA
jgi:ubiquinone/menaquinone biosynthesis C-methylase UbiE